MKELKLINLIKNTLSDSTLIGDDAACVDNLVMTQDTLVEDIHFRQKTISPFELGIKSVAINLSDIAASGGIPKYILVSLSLPTDIKEDYVEKLYTGINDICYRHGVIVVGGDITGGEKIVISITAIGLQDGVIPSSRKNAKVGDVIVVTGNHGSSRAGFELLERGVTEPLSIIQSHTTPIPMLVEGRKIACACSCVAMMDTSDGLADALYKIGTASDLTLDVNFSDIPYAKEVSSIAGNNLKKWVLFGGEDYELLACISKQEYESLKREISLYKIGEVIEKQDAPAVINFESEKFLINEEALREGAFNHFGDKEELK